MTTDNIKRLNIKYGTKELERDYGPLTFAKILVAHRLAENMTQKDYAQLLGISQQSLCDLEKGRKMPSPERVAKIAHKLKEPPDFWLTIALQDLLRAHKLYYDITMSTTSKPRVKKAS